jgi:hypothetical protein
VQEEEMRRAAEEKQRAEDEEASKWMNMISVEDTVSVVGCYSAPGTRDTALWSLNLPQLWRPAAVAIAVSQHLL